MSPPTSNFISRAVGILPHPQPIKNGAYFPHSSSQNWHQQIWWSRALDTPILSFPPPRHRRRASLIFYPSNSQHPFDQVYILRSVIYLTHTYLSVKLASIQSCWNKLWFVTGYISIIFNLTILIIPKEIRDRSFRGVDYLIVTGIYDSRWRASSRSRLSASGRKFSHRKIKYTRIYPFWYRAIFVLNVFLYHSCLWK